MSNFINSKKHLVDKKLLFFLSFGMIADEKRAHSAAEWFANCRVAAEEELGREFLLQTSGTPLFENIRALLDKIVLDCLKEKPGSPTLLGFSAGFDSQAILKVLREYNIPHRTYTFGQEGMLDYDFVKLLSHRLSIENLFINFKQVNWSLSEYQQQLPKLKAHTLSPRVFIDSVLSEKFQDRREFHGYLNDHITGATLRENVLDWSQAKRDFSRNNDPFRLQRMIGESTVDDLLPEKPLIDMPALPLERQLDLSYRQWQRIRPKDRPQKHFLLPFEDQRWVGFWLARPMGDVRGQRLYLEFLKNLDDEIFYDLKGIKAYNRRAIRRHRIGSIYGNPYYAHIRLAARKLGLISQHSIIPDQPTTQFPFFVCYQTNQSLKIMVNELVDRLKGREIFSRFFIDDVFRQFKTGNNTAAFMLRGLVSADLLWETGVLE